MRDILLQQGDDGFDPALMQGDLVGDDSLATAVLVSLFTDVRAGADELPPEYRERRGFWGDALLATAGDEQGIGSKLWLLFREKQMDSVAAAAEGYARQALQWLVDDGIAGAVDVTASNSTPGVISLAVSITRADPELVKRVTTCWTVTVSGETVTIQEAR